MVRRVFLHIGAPKTGTTYLQDTLARNRALLAAHGLTYPRTRSGSHFEAAIDLLDQRWGGALEAARGSWDALAQAVNAAPGDVVVSHEVLAAATPVQVRRALESLTRTNAELHIVHTARDLARQIPAEWQERVKHRGRRGFSRFLDRVQQAPRIASDDWFWRVQGLPDVLGRWSTGLPPERVHLVIVPPAGAEPGRLWARFAGVLGLDGGLPIESGERANPSMGAVETAFLRRLNVKLARHSIPQPVYAELVRDLLGHRLLAKREEMTRVELPPSVRPFVEEVTGEWVEWVEGSGINVVGDLAELEPLWSDEPWQDPDRPRPRQLAEVAVTALAEMIAAEAERREAESTLSRFRRRLRT